MLDHKEGGGFAQKAAIAVLGVTTAGMLTFFIWLASAIGDIRERVVRIEMHIESLLATRTEQAVEEKASTSERIDELEKDSR